MRVPLDLAANIANFLLADDVVDYMNFRAVCSEWRSRTASPPRGFHSCFRPRRWMMLTDGDANLDTATGRRFLNLSTGRCLVLRGRSQLHTHAILSESDGLFFLVDNATHVVRLFNPFTRHLADLPPFPMFSRTKFEIPTMIKLFNSCISSGSCPTVGLFSPHLRAAYFAKPGDHSWEILHFEVSPDSMLCFNDRFYLANSTSGIASIELEKKFLESLTLPPSYVHGRYDRYYLVEYNKEMLLVCKKATSDDGELLQVKDHTFLLYRVDLESGSLFVQFLTRSDLTLFLGFRGRCRALSLKGLPSIKDNSIYFCTGIPANPIGVCNINFVHQEQHEYISMDTALHDGRKRKGPSIRPFTLAHHLVTYCASLNWSIGLMYHEFAEFPEGWFTCDWKMEDLARKYSVF